MPEYKGSVPRALLLLAKPKLPSSTETVALVPFIKSAIHNSIYSLAFRAAHRNTPGIITNHWVALRFGNRHQCCNRPRVGNLVLQYRIEQLGNRRHQLGVHQKFGWDAINPRSFRPLKTIKSRLHFADSERLLVCTHKQWNRGTTNDLSFIGIGI